MVTISQMRYRIEQAENQRWGIYEDERLLATIGSYEACRSVWKYLQQELSYTEDIKSRLSYRNAIDKNLIVGSNRRAV